MWNASAAHTAQRYRECKLAKTSPRAVPFERFSPYRCALLVQNTSRVSSAVRNRLAVTNPSFADAERVPLTTHAAQCAQACTRYSYAKAFAAGR